MTNLQLKLLAIILMTIDHVGAILFPEMIVFRIIGRLAFPIFAFLLVEGFLHTRNIKKYLIRLGFFALISEPVFDLAFNGKISLLNGSNIFFTLFYGLILMIILELYKKEKLPFLQTFVGIVACVFMISAMDADYGLYGLLTITIFYFAEDVYKSIPMLMLLNLIYIILMAMMDGSMIQIVSLMAIFPIVQYNGRRGKKLKQINIYAYYPAHLLLLILISKVMT